MLTKVPKMVASVRPGAHGAAVAIVVIIRP